ncbi:hypothetical protein [Burkholderia anthina]|uniref:hypothetical protein n=1 Tax=Burkholderia anthina TaxID=179879 RepID=UPI003340CF90
MQNARPGFTPSYDSVGAESPASAVSWGAIFAGAVVAVAISVALLTGGTGLGFLSVSPWRNEGASGSALAVGSIVWLFVTQIIAYGIAGYVAGRLRTKWTDAAGDEIYFRDTAHGLVVWAVSALVGVVLLGSTIASVASGTAKAGATLAGAGAGAAAGVVGHIAPAGADHGSLDYFTDTLLRPNDPAAVGSPADVHQEISRILARSLVNGNLDDADQTYLVKLIAQRAGIDEAAAQQRLSEVEAQVTRIARDTEQKAREAADAARKAVAVFSLWAFASMLVGAFVASFGATIGGRARDC